MRSSPESAKYPNEAKAKRLSFAVATKLPILAGNAQPNQPTICAIEKWRNGQNTNTTSIPERTNKISQFWRRKSIRVLIIVLGLRIADPARFRTKKICPTTKQAYNKASCFRWLSSANAIIRLSLQLIIFCRCVRFDNLRIFVRPKISVDDCGSCCNSSSPDDAPAKFFIVRSGDYMTSGQVKS